ncbi:MAG: hypothetical protein LBS19_02150 [Clostridiales bacterium]|nr:hypothetical protein [Clostridiales bacterium]
MYTFMAYCTCPAGSQWRYDGRHLQKGKSRYRIPCIDEIMAVNPFTGNYEEMPEDGELP